MGYIHAAKAHTAALDRSETGYGLNQLALSVSVNTCDTNDLSGMHIK